ncbi:hypothetical protein CRT60_22645 [Azospirillum palustre]|uniref:Uncharacterized protein n=2 Tax=Azospirillum palustre TaxID=2044885 RepID=A0A2B8B5B1_9PROT|nr:hypothetical protein CRT60_22645 [Azospirillum palustre]
MMIPPELQEFILRSREIARAHAVDALISAAGAYRDEIDRQDNLHRARLRQREETMMLAAEDLLATRRPLANLTHADLDLYRRSMEAAAKRDLHASAPKRPAS